VSRAKDGLLHLKCSGVEHQLANSGNKRLNEPPLISSKVQGIDTNWFGRTHETTHNQATLTAPLGMADSQRRMVALRSATSFIDASARGLQCTKERSTAWYLRITLIREVNSTCPADEYLRAQ
jgi:hypothetical protein